MAIPSSLPHPLTQKILPVTLGHEFCGTIKSTSPNSKFSVGQAVIADPRQLCQSCVRCNAHQSNSCLSLGFKGLSGDGGGFSDSVAINTNFLYPIPTEKLPYAALIEPLAVAWHAVKVPHKPTYAGSTILILGGGPIGVALTFVLRRFGADRIFISEPTKRRREQDLEIANEVFDPTSQNVPELCLKRTGGIGVDFVFDAAGSVRGLADGVGAVRMRGTIVVVASYGSTPVSSFAFVLTL
jgi:threonine dehydrogenase-like Zn-dependent dehydrogenase